MNQPGGYCWQGTTPDIRPGDVVRISDDGTGVADQTTVAAVTAQRPVQTAVGTVVVHGTAAQADGSRIPVTLLAGWASRTENTSTPSRTVLQTQADVTAPSVPAGLVARR